MDRTAVARLREKGYGPDTARTDREHAIFWLAAAGCTHREIAGLFGLTRPTISRQLTATHIRLRAEEAAAIAMATCGGCWARPYEPCLSGTGFGPSRDYGGQWFHLARRSRAWRRGLLPEPYVSEPPQLKQPVLLG